MTEGSVGGGGTDIHLQGGGLGESGGGLGGGGGGGGGGGVIILGYAEKTITSGTLSSVTNCPGGTGGEAPTSGTVGSDGSHGTLIEFAL